MYQIHGKTNRIGEWLAPEMILQAPCTQEKKPDNLISRVRVCVVDLYHRCVHAEISFCLYPEIVKKKCLVFRFLVFMFNSRSHTQCTCAVCSVQLCNEHYLKSRFSGGVQLLLWLLPCQCHDASIAMHLSENKFSWCDTAANAYQAARNDINIVVI